MIQQRLVCFGTYHPTGDQYNRWSWEIIPHSKVPCTLSANMLVLGITEQHTALGKNYARIDYCIEGRIAITRGVTVPV